MKVTFIAIDKGKNESDWVLDAQQIGIGTSIQDSKTGLTLTNIKFEEDESVPLDGLVIPKIAEDDCVKVWQIAQDGEYGAWQYCYKNSQGGEKNKKEALYQASFFDKPIVVIDKCKGVIESNFSE